MSGEEPIVWSMSLPVEEFIRQIGYLPSSYQWDRENHKGKGAIAISMPSGGHVRLRCQPQSPRRLGALSFPVTRISIDFDEVCLSDEREVFIQTLRRVCQRGGG